MIPRVVITFNRAMTGLYIQCGYAQPSTVYNNWVNPSYYSFKGTMERMWDNGMTLSLGYGHSVYLKIDAG